MTNNIRKTIFRCVATTLALTPFLFAASPAGAQGESRTFDEIIVTANKREENIQNIGISITALDAATLAAFGITDVRRLAFAVPGLVYADAGNDAKFNLRGANSTNTFRDNPSIVGTFVDGVYKAKASQQTRAFFDVERLEFLKGPQGTLYGRNTFAGALNLYTFKPNTERVSGGLTTSFERFSTLRMEGFVNLPVNDTFAVRLAGYTENGEGYIENSAGQDIGAPDALGVRLSALWAPSDNLDFIFRYQYVEEQGTAAGLFGYILTCRSTNADGITDAFGSVTDCQNPNRGPGTEPFYDGNEHKVAYDFDPDNDLTESVFTLEINWDVGSVGVQSITSYTDFDNEVPQDFDFSGTNASVGGFDEYVESFTQELVISSNYESAFQWTAGAYYSNDEYFNTFWIYNPTLADNSVRPVDPATGLTVLNGTPQVSTALNFNGAFADSNYIEATVKAVFAQAHISFTDSLRLILGVRESEEDKDAHGGGSNFTAGGAPVTFIATEVNGTFPQTRLTSFSFDEFAAGSNVISRSFSNTSWKAGIEYNFNDDMMFYVTGSTGFLSGSLNNDGTSTDEQESELWEVGIKSVLMDGSMLFNLAYHDTEYTNLVAQLQTTDPNTGIVITTTRNGGDIDASGIDLELQYIPTDEWLLGFAVAWLDAEFGDFGQTPPFQLNRGVPSTFENQRGITPGWSPEIMVNFNAAYTIDLANGGTLTPAIYFSYSDEYNTSNLYIPDPRTRQDSFTKTDLRLVWNSPNGNYTVAAYIENLEDDAVLSRSNYGSQDHIQTGFLYPQNYGISFQARWQ